MVMMGFCDRPCRSEYLIRAVFAILVVILVAACSFKQDETEKAKAIVLRYAELLSQGYAGMNMNGLAQVAEMEQATKDYHHMAALGEARTRMFSKLKGITFSEISFANHTSAFVKTREVWDFRHVDVKDSSRVILDEKDFVYVTSYRLARRNGGWMVRNVTVDVGNSDSRR